MDEMEQSGCPECERDACAEMDAGAGRPSLGLPAFLNCGLPARRYSARAPSKPLSALCNEVSTATPRAQRRRWLQALSTSAESRSPRPDTESAPPRSERSGLAVALRGCPVAPNPTASTGASPRPVSSNRSYRRRVGTLLLPKPECLLIAPCLATTPRRQRPFDGETSGPG
jgi:hypothetical protein